MRIIAGKFKNRNLKFVSNEKTRPTANVVREGLFCKIQFELSDSVFLDLFSGSGAIGIEALSRGAKKVYFVEKDKYNFQIIKENLKTCGANEEEFEVFNLDFATALNNIKEKLDFVFLDPPYNSNFCETAAKLLIEKKLLSEKSMVICEHEAKKQISLPFLKLVCQKKYGIKMLSYFKIDFNG